MKNKSILSILLLFFFKFVLDYTYINYVHVIYPEFTLIIKTSKVIESYALTWFLGFIVIKWFNQLKKPSYIVIYILLLNLFLPLFSFYSLSDSPRAFVYIAIASYLIVISFVRFGKSINLFYFLESKAILITCIIGISVIVFGNLVIGGGLSRLSLDLLKVYEVREQYLSNKGFMMGYFLPWSAYSINTLLISYFLYKKKKLAVVLILLFQLFLYATTGFKSYLFSPLLILLIHFALNKRKMTRLLPLLTFGFAIAIVYSYILYKVNGDILTASIFTRRNFFTPAQINFLYYDFFSENPFVMLSDSIFRLFIENPYGNITPVLYQVSEYYYGRQFGLNVGYIGNAFMHFGYIGVFLFSILLGLILKVIDSISNNLPISVTVSSIIIPSMAFVNSGFFTVLLTHGFLISCLLIWLLNSQETMKGRKIKQ